MPLPALAVLLVLAAAGWFLNTRPQEAPAPQAATSSVSASAASSTQAMIYYLDVGQGDSELIRLPGGENVLIDTGTGETADKLVSLLQELGVKRVDRLIATHPHEDHIGGMESVVRKIPVGKIYMPKVADKQIPTTRTYEGLIDAISDKKMKITQAKAGMTIPLSGQAKLELLAPNGTQYDDLNNYSVVAKLTYGQKTFLFTGDAEKLSEKEMLNKNYDLKCDVLKCGHHGSSSSTSAAFLKAVSPQFAVISCGLNNDYGHPNKEVLSRLQKAGVKVYRTDLQGTILARCDGRSITFETGQKSLVKD
ncbi:MAG TPA: MBL fold metallo-hydrolase [Ruminococcaceae bacterium]|jgi:beta-lactamase superfamily II metal-dependent hydrolase|nr:MBL fold metallo-hydrolase [Oscillospiraceae bacterium]